MPFIGRPAFVVCLHCTRMYNGMQCPNCGSHKAKPFRETTTEERRRWKAKKHFADPEKEK